MTLKMFWMKKMWLYGDEEMVVDEWMEKKTDWEWKKGGD